MRKNCLLFLVAVASAGLLASCAKEEPFGEAPLVPATIRLSIPEEGLTKVTLTQESGANAGVKLAWESTDVITVQNGADPTLSVQFVYKSGAGTATAEFTATDITPLIGASSYNICLTSNLPGGYGNQTQAANGSTAHLGYAATLSGVGTYDGATFSEAWAEGNGGSFASSSVLRISAQLPTAAMADAVQKVVVKASAPLFDEDKELTVTLATPGVDGDGKIVTAYATLPAGDVQLAAGTELLFQFQVSDDVNDKYTAYRKLDAAKTLSAGQVNYFNVNCPNIQSFAGVADDGTQDKPYLIGDRHQMDAMHSLLGDEETKYFRMVDDIDLSAISTWQPLCLSASENRQIFFDGGGHIISHLTAGSTYNYPSFFGYLWGEVRNVIFDEANITCGDDKDHSGGVVSGYMGGSSHEANCNGVTIRNSTLTSNGGSAYVGGLGGRVGKAASILNCHVVNTSVSTASGGTCVGGLLAYIASNSSLTIAGCSAEGISVTGYGHYAGGLVAQIASPYPVSIRRCHTTGEVKRSSSGRHFGGLVGSVQSADVQIINSYSTCSVTGYQFNGGLVGSWWSSSSFSGGSGIIDHCFASGAITDVGNSGDGGLVGALEVPGVTITNSVAWNTSISPNKYGKDNYSSGAIVGRSHPNSHFEDNYRKPGLDITAYWTPSAIFDHPNSQKNGVIYYIWKIGNDLIEANGDYTTATALSTPHGLWAYHGKHLDAGALVEPDDTYGWISSDIAGGSESTDDPENPAYTGNNVWNLGTTYPVVDGVTYTNFHGTWEGKVREINIITTTLNEHNKLNIYYNYSDEGLCYLDEKCEHVNAVAGTNGSMTSQFIRVDDYVKRPGNDSNSEWMHNCALTIDGDKVDIVKVENNADAATLPNQTVSCAGPLLVWKGNKLTASAEWLAADTNEWLTTGGNAGGQPRTAIGISKDGKKVIQVTVDGRWTSSSDTAKQAYGMETDLLAELMLQLGCYKAMNLDGGGGTQMWVYDRGDVHHIVNHPHNAWPTYESESGIYYWKKDNEVGRRKACCAVYIHSDLK